MDISKIIIEVGVETAEDEAVRIRAMLEKIPLEINGEAKASFVEGVLIIDSEFGIKDISNDIGKGEVLFRSVHFIQGTHPILKLSLRYEEHAINIILPVHKNIC